MAFAAKDFNSAQQNIKTVTIGSELVQVMLPALGTTATLTRTAQNVADVTLLASNTARISAKIYNDATAGNLKVSLTGAVTSTNFTVVLAPGSYIEFADFTGVIHGLWDAAGSGQALVTEITP